jgi:hypothetical protein
MDEKLAKVLNDSQMKRLKQLRLQREGAIALVRKEIADKVGLSDDDRYKIRGMIDEAMESHHGDQDGPPDPNEMRDFHTLLGQKILKSLSSSQRSKWENLAGKPFKFDEKWHPQGPDFGSRGGQMRHGGGEGRGDGPPPPPEDEDDGGLEAALVRVATHEPANVDCF